MDMSLHQLEIKDGHIFLDGMMIKGITSFNLVHKGGEIIPKLTLKMEVRTLPRSTTKTMDEEKLNYQRNSRKNEKKKRLCSACFTELPEKANYCPACGKCMREVVEQTSEYIGSSPVTTIVGINDCAIHVRNRNATSTNHST